jgi:hypothetical protein
MPAMPPISARTLPSRRYASLRAPYFGKKEVYEGGSEWIGSEAAYQAERQA